MLYRKDWFTPTERLHKELKLLKVKDTFHAKWPNLLTNIKRVHYQMYLMTILIEMIMYIHTEQDKAISYICLELKVLQAQKP